MIHPKTSKLEVDEDIVLLGVLSHTRLVLAALLSSPFPLLSLVLSSQLFAGTSYVDTSALTFCTLCVALPNLLQSSLSWTNENKSQRS